MGSAQHRGRASRQQRHTGVHIIINRVGQNRIYTPYLTRMYGDFPANTGVHIIIRVGQNCIYTPYLTRIYDEFPAKNTVCTPYIPIYTPYLTVCMVLANPSFNHKS
jgi:hypothetical protein